MDKKYELLARELEASISEGTFRPGERLPSVRELVASRGVSPSTVFEAYALLESRGVVEARPRAGYFARQRSAAAPQPAISKPATSPRPVAIHDLVMEVLGSVRDHDVIPLGSAFPNPALFPLERLARGMGAGMRRLEPARMLRDLTPGNDELRRQLALRYVAHGTLASADEIVLTSGAMEALNLCLQAVTKPGDAVAIESPAFYGCLQALERLGLKAVEIATHPRDGVQLDSLAAALQRQAIKACWFMPNLQNPTGASMPADNRKALVELLARHRVPLIEDDVYAELYFGVRRPLPAKSFDREGWVMHCSSFSKSLAPGYRVGWVAAGRFVREVERLKLMGTISVAVPSQVAVLEFLLRGAFDRHLRQLRATLAAQQALAVRAITKHFPAGTRVTTPDGGYFLWVELPREVDAFALHGLALSHGISLAPGPLFSGGGRFTHHVRVNYGHPTAAQLESGLRTVGKMAGLTRRTERPAPAAARASS
ncbi:PLP-dependent aminotransferase family protein [Ramlibacter albus]|uniref:aminotransferase-like domain-containing protein n=1 Tax=Ramlibacter albus TaxID=2079448 RepID=UPI00338D7CBD